MTTSDHAITTQGLGRRFGRQWVVKDVAMKVPRGSVYGFLGLNGAGKSTTMRMLMGVLTPHEGKVSVVGKDPQEDGIDVKRRVGYVGEKPYFYDWMTVRELMAFVAHYRRGQWDDKRAEHLLEVFKLPRDKKVKVLSKGQQAKVSLLLAMAFHPELLILDEPTLGLDPVVRREFVETLLAEYMEAGNTIFVSSHLINEIAGLVDWVGILHEGKLVCEEPVDTLRQRVRRARLLFESDAPLKLALPNVRRERRKGREILVTVDHFDPEITPAQLSATGASKVVIEELGLEDLFVDFIGGGDAS